MSEKTDLVVEARQLLGATTQGPLKLLRYDHGGGRLRHAESSTLVADFYHEGDRELYYRAPELLRALADEAERLRKNATAVYDCDKCDLCEDHHDNH